jgi:hypothetical protein
VAPGAEAQPAPATSEEEDSDGGEFAALRRDRLRALRRAAEDAARAAAAPAAIDYADVREADLSALAASSRALVVHLPLPGCSACDEVDEALAERARAAFARQQARFVRLVPSAGGAAALGRAAAALLGGRGAPVRPPALALLCRGRAPTLLRSLAPLCCSEGTLDELLLERWLARAGAPAEDGSDEEGDEPEGQPCAACGRTYPHEHVRALRSGGDAAGSEGDD